MSSLRPSGTMAYFTRVRDLVRSGRDIISLATGELHTATPEHVSRAGVRAIREGFTKYTLNPGLRELRNAIARRVSETHGVRYSFDQAIVSSGSKQALFNTMYAACGPGDEVLVPSPYYPSYPEQVKMAGATPVLVPTTRDTGFQLDEGLLRSHVTERTRVIIINSPNNPTGAVYNSRSLAAVAKIARETGCWIISDDIYEAIVYPPAVSGSILQLAPDLADRVIIVSGFSKSYAMTGWRIGYAVGPKELIDAAALVQSHVTNNASTISQYAALTALEEPSDFRTQLVEQLARQRDKTTALLRSIPGIVCPAAEGAFYLFPDITALLGGTAGERPIRTSSDLALHLLEEHEVAVVPGSAFGTEGHLRVSYATAESRLTEGLRRMQRGLEQIRR